MFKMEVLKTSDEEWDRLVGDLELNDILYSRGYYDLHSRFLDAEAEMFTFSDGENYVIYPYLKKRINSLPFLASTSLARGKPFFDISNLEYGGPAVSGDRTIVQEFLAGFHRYCMGHRIVTEWCRLHPYLENHRDIPGTEEVQDVFYVDLRKSAGQIFQEYEKTCRTAVRKAIKEGVEIITTRDRKDLDEFYAMYLRTMESHGSKAFYRYSRPFFDDLFRTLRDSIQLFAARKDGKAIAASLFLSGRDIAHYYLSGRDPASSGLYPNNLLLHEAILYYRERGCSIFNLGGKYGHREGLARFKEQFTRTKKSYYRLKAVHNERVYTRFCSVYRDYLKTSGLREGEETYFPLYRSLE